MAKKAKNRKKKNRNSRIKNKELKDGYRTRTGIKAI